MTARPPVRLAPPAAVLPAVLVAACLSASSVVLAQVPAAPIPLSADLGPDEAAVIVTRILGLRASEPREDATAFVFDPSGFRDARTCPLEGVRDVRCGEFAFLPARVSMHRATRVGAVSGHLARNRVVLLEMASDDAGVAFGTLHGALVFPGPGIGARDRPAFAWYVGRAARALSADLQDVNGDGTLDLVYTYAQRLPGGRRIVARDVWTFSGLQAEKLISSGEKLSGVGTSTFDGVPLLEDGPGGSVRGAFRFEALGPGGARAGVLERARLSGARSGWDLRVVADLGEGWREVLAGSGPPSDVPDLAETACRPAEVLPEADVEVRRRLLDLETACRAALDASDGRTPQPWRVPQRLRAALSLAAAGLPMAALGLRERAAADLALASPRAYFVAVLLSLSVAIPADRALASALGPGSGAARWDALSAFPVLSPLFRPLDAGVGLVRILASWWARGGV